MSSETVEILESGWHELECLGCAFSTGYEPTKFFEPISFEKHLLKHRRIGHKVNRKAWERAKQFRSNFTWQSTLGGSE